MVFLSAGADMMVLMISERSALVLSCGSGLNHLYESTKNAVSTAENRAAYNHD